MECVSSIEDGVIMQLAGKSDRVMDIGYALLVASGLFGFPIVSFAPVLVHVASRPISTSYRLTVALASAAYLIWAVVRRRPAQKPAVRGTIGILVLLLLLRLLWDSSLAPLPRDVPWDDMWGQFIAIALIPFLPFLFLPDTGGLTLVRTFCLWAGVLALIALVGGVVLSLRADSFSGRLSTDVINPISVGNAGVSMFIIGLTQWPESARLAWSRTRNAARALLAVSGIVLCVLSASKGPLLGLFLSLMVIFGLRVIKLPRWRQYLELGLAAAVLGVFASITVVLANSGVLTIYDRLSDLGADESTQLHMQAWRGAIGQFDVSPIFGSSVIELSTRFYPHNVVLEVMIATGVVGLLLFLFLLLLSVVASVSILKRLPEYCWIALLFWQQFIGAMVAGSIYLDSSLWVAMLMVMGIAQRYSGYIGERPTAAENSAGLLC